MSHAAAACMMATRTRVETRPRAGLPRNLPRHARTPQASDHHRGRLPAGARDHRPARQRRAALLDRTTPPTATLGDRSVFELAIPDGEMVDMKIVRGNDWAHGRNYTLHAGDHLHLRPSFERTTCRLMPPVVLPASPWPLRYQVLLPPSYDEQSSRHYPVLYAQDGQALWSSSSDPFGIWALDTVINQLLEIAVMSELIVVGIDTSEARIDASGPAAIRSTAAAARRSTSRRSRACSSRASTPSSARAPAARTPPSSARRSAASSPSTRRGRARGVRQGHLPLELVLVGEPRMIRDADIAPSPRPTIYLDSGVALNPDAPSQDGFQHTRSMQRALVRAGYTNGEDLHSLAFPGQVHSTAAWSARVAIPLQLLFPPPPLTQVPAKSIAP